MELTNVKNSDKLTVNVNGRVDTTTAPELEQYLSSNLDGVTELTLDFKEMSYISSAGLRVLLVAQKRMNKQGKMTVVNANTYVKEIFEVTGFSDILTIL